MSVMNGSERSERGSHSGGRICTGPNIVFELQERIDLQAVETMMASEFMCDVKKRDLALFEVLVSTVSVATTLGGRLPVQYYHDEDQGGYGRLKSRVTVDGMGTPITPYVRMKRHVRAHLASSIYHDVDMVNCQPNILHQALAKRNIQCPLLERYVVDRESCLTEIATTAGVSRDAAKKLMLRLMYFGTVRGWAQDNGFDPHDIRVPEWVRAFGPALQDAATELLARPEMADLKAACAKRFSSADADDDDIDDVFGVDDDVDEDERTVPTLMSMYLQTCECNCVRALVDAVHRSGRKVGAIIHDGLLVERRGSESAVPTTTLAAWKDAIKRDTGLTMDLVVKQFDTDPALSTVSKEAPDWITSLTEMSLPYAELKALWERQAFKIIKSGNYVIEDVDGSRDLYSERTLTDSFKHLNYITMRGDSKRGGGVKVTTHSFITKWVHDKNLRSYKSMTLSPPPLVAPPSAYNIWSGIPVQRDADAHADEDTGEDAKHPAVSAYLDLIEAIGGRNPAVTEYILDWIAQIFQEPAKKTGIALIIKGPEGVGKNRTTDLLRLMLEDKFMQTATPSTLYGRFNRMREGKLLIVVNEANGADNFAANDILKDMVTCDEFVSEGKGTNAYSVPCFARFIFTTNNDSCVKVNPDSGRYVVVEASADLKGRTDYFVQLSRHIDDPRGRRAFYRFLMARDISRVDWINMRPVTSFMTSMMDDINMPSECQFVKNVVRHAYYEGKKEIVVQCNTLFLEFREWMAKSHPGQAFNMSDKKFGVRMTNLVKTATNVGFVGLTKNRKGMGVVYSMDVDKMAREMVDKKWAARDDFVRKSGLPDSSP